MKKQESIVMYNSNPLPDEYSSKAKKLYIFCAVCCFGGIVAPTLFGLGIITLIVGVCLLCEYLERKRKKLREVKFKFTEGVDYDQIFEAIQPVLMRKYGMELERGKDNIVIVLYNKMIYDIHINDDNTFIIWWRVSAGRAFFMPDRVKKEYFQIRQVMGIIAFEIQSAFGINSQAAVTLEKGEKV